MPGIANLFHVAIKTNNLDDTASPLRKLCRPDTAPQASWSHKDTR